MLGWTNTPLLDCVTVQGVIWSEESMQKDKEQLAYMLDQQAPTIVTVSNLFLCLVNSI